MPRCPSKTSAWSNFKDHRKLQVGKCAQRPVFSIKLARHPIFMNRRVPPKRAVRGAVWSHEAVKGSSKAPSRWQSASPTVSAHHCCAALTQIALFRDRGVVHRLLRRLRCVDHRVGKELEERQHAANGDGDKQEIHQHPSSWALACALTAFFIHGCSVPAARCASVRRALTPLQCGHRKPLVARPQGRWSPCGVTAAYEKRQVPKRGSGRCRRPFRSRRRAFRRLAEADGARREPPR